ncbi:hypothetical protein NQD34_015334 [Periophthalmus magnuspinnatus]|nr:hypothetical protein NQD34_015334 [Periophthalmus magnuspinnatus]
MTCLCLYSNTSLSSTPRCEAKRRHTRHSSARHAANALRVRGWILCIASAPCLTGKVLVSNGELTTYTWPVSCSVQIWARLPLPGPHDGWQRVQVCDGGREKEREGEKERVKERDQAPRRMSISTSV